MSNSATLCLPGRSSVVNFIDELTPSGIGKDSGSSMSEFCDYVPSAQVELREFQADRNCGGLAGVSLSC
jgi:hypothetical protein